MAQGCERGWKSDLLPQVLVLAGDRVLSGAAPPVDRRPGERGINVNLVREGF